MIQIMIKIKYVTWPKKFRPGVFEIAKIERGVLKKARKSQFECCIIGRG
jgi:hypothetical protein